MISHGYKVKEKDDPIVRLAELGGEQLSAVTEPGAFLVDLIPSCEFSPTNQLGSKHLISRSCPVSSLVRYVPSWFPGTGWKKTAEAWRQDLLNLLNAPHQYALDQLVSCAEIWDRLSFPIRKYSSLSRQQAPRSHLTLQIFWKMARSTTIWSNGRR